MVGKFSGRSPYHRPAIPKIWYYIIVLDLMTRNPFYFIVRRVADVVYKCFTPAAAESVRMFKVGGV